MKFLIPAALVLLAGCAATPESLDSVARTESARMSAPSRPFSSFANFELKPMTLSPAVLQEHGKVERAGELDARMHAKLEPLFNEWRSAPRGPVHSGRLVIEPQLASLKVVSGGARFWAGAMAGSSNIDLDLSITDGDTGQLIAKPRISMTADAMAGGWSIGKTDTNLMDYIAAVSYQYLRDHY
jgi:hypothetical protein